MSRSLGCLIGSVALALVATSAAASEDARPSLVGLSGVRVIVEPSTTAQQAGIGAEVFQTRAELFLRSQGIAVLSEEEAMKTDRLPLLHVKVDAGEGANVTWTAEVAFYQNVATLAVPPATVLAQTWSGVGGFGRAPRAQVSVYVWRAVGEQLTEFANDWLAANAEPASSREPATTSHQ